MAGCGGLGATVALAGCGLLGSGNTLAAPAVMAVSSSSLVGGALPSRYTCAATRTVSPPINWTGAPKGTQSIAIVFDDSDAPITPYVYWIAFDIGPGTSAILDGQLQLPPGTKQARGSAGYDRYDAPCPGQQGHKYRITVYALNRVLDLPNGTSLLSVWQAIAAATIGRGRVTVSATS
jgi:Raf kinase inhibitor-like YbhB/YbcL family protein